MSFDTHPAMTTHAEKRHIPFTPEQMFNLVADVAKYPEFLPWCLAARVRSTSKTELNADLIIGFQMFRESFSSRVDLDVEQLKIHARYTDGPFKYLENNWCFIRTNDGCLIDFYVDFEFSNRLLQSVIESLFTEAVKKMVAAFEARAHSLYAPQIQHSSG